MAHEGLAEGAPAAAVEVAFCGPAERAQQARLFNACFRKRVDADSLAWRYDRNPHGQAISLVSRPPGGEAVSGYACSPRRAVAGGDEASLAPVGETGDVMTHPQWRKRGLFSALDRAAMARAAELGWPLCFGLPNRRSAHIFLELGWERVGTVRPHALVLRADARARAALRPDGRARAWLAPLAVARGRRARARLRRDGAGLRLLPIARFPREVEALSREVERRHAFMVRRDADYLDWRFLRSPSGLHRCQEARDAQGRFAGYCVVQAPREDGVGYLVDVLARDAATQSACLEAGLAELERAGAAVARATAIDGTPWAAALARAGFSPPRPENHLIVILHPHRTDHPLVAAARDTARWHFTDGDRDDETMG